jgi:hypothetical protein
VFLAADRGRWWRQAVMNFWVEHLVLDDQRSEDQDARQDQPRPNRDSSNQFRTLPLQASGRSLIGVLLHPAPGQRRTEEDPTRKARTAIRPCRRPPLPFDGRGLAHRFLGINPGRSRQLAALGSCAKRQVAGRTRKAGDPVLARQGLPPPYLLSCRGHASGRR